MTEGEGGEVRYRREGSVVTVVFHRPEARNAMTWAMYESLDRALDRIEEEEGLGTVVLRGAGGHFVSGTDIGQFKEFSTPEDGVEYERRLDALLDRLEAVPVPTLAVVEGAAVGGGLALAAVCDLRICTPDARFGVPIAMFGHAGDGNFHVTPMKPESMAGDGWAPLFETLLRSLYDEVIRLGGTISGEHGIGRKRVKYLADFIEPAQLAAMRAIKELFDPNEVLNPGVVLGPRS